MDDRIAIIYTTFLRIELAKKTLTSIFKCIPKNMYLFLGDQCRGQIEGSKDFSPANKTFYWIDLPFDCGISFARNRLIEAAKSYGIEYCLLTADSIEFIPQTVEKLNLAVDFFKSYRDVGILGFDLYDRVPWEYFMDIQDMRFVLTKTGDLEIDPKTGLRIKRCDICRQFFLAKIETILAVKWDEAFKTGEHEDFFWRYKQSGFKVCWTPDIVGKYINDKPEEYLKYRNRQYNEFRQMLFKKHGLNDWVEYR
jgi:GT2 family glycosyltransferase